MTRQSLQRTKTLVFMTWDYFRTWYTDAKKRFKDLAVRYLHHTRCSGPITVVISY